MDGVGMFLISGTSVQRVVEVRAVANGRVQVVCEPDRTPRWVSLDKPRTKVSPRVAP